MKSAMSAIESALVLRIFDFILVFCGAALSPPINRLSTEYTAKPRISVIHNRLSFCASFPRRLQGNILRAGLRASRISAATVLTCGSVSDQVATDVLFRYRVAWLLKYVRCSPSFYYLAPIKKDYVVRYSRRLLHVVSYNYYSVVLFEINY